MKKQRNAEQPEIDDKKFSFGGYWLKTNSYTFYGYFKAMLHFLSMAKIHKLSLKIAYSDTAKWLYKEALTNARKMAILYMARVECPYGISFSGLLKVKIH